MVLNVVGANVGRMTLLYSAVVESPGLEFNAYWRSFPSTLHSRNIDAWAGNEETGGRAPVEVLLFDSMDRNVYLRMRGHARRVPPEGVEAAAQALGKIRIARGEDPMYHRPEVPYEMAIDEFSIPVRLLTGEEHTGEDHEMIHPRRLSGFAEGRGSLRNRSALLARRVLSWLASR